MPFSRRAEAEADLIGLKLMALAGYNADKAPETFRRLGAMEVGGKMANMAGSNTARMVLQVGHCHSATAHSVLVFAMLSENNTPPRAPRTCAPRCAGVCKLLQACVAAHACPRPAGMESKLPERVQTLVCVCATCKAHPPDLRRAVTHQVQCTHPRSDSRVKMLTEELEMMKQHGDTALDRVMHPVSYWSL